MQFLRIPNLQTTASETRSFTWTLFLIIYGFVCQFSLLYYWHCYNQKQSSGVLYEKGVSQISQESTCSKDTFLMKLQIYSLTLSKKRFRHRCFFVNSGKFLIKPFLKNPSDGCFCINTHSVYFPNTILHLFKNNVTHIFRLSIFSA